MVESPKSAAEGRRELGFYDVICGRHKLAFNNIGNRRFRIMVALAFPAYMQAPTRRAKSVVVQKLVHLVREVGGLFLTWNHQSKNWEELDEKKSREKTAHAFRDMLGKKNKRASRLLSQELGSKEQQDDEASNEVVLEIHQSPTTSNLLRRVSGDGSELDASLKKCSPSSIDSASDDMMLGVTTKKLLQNPSQSCGTIETEAMKIRSDECRSHPQVTDFYDDPLYVFSLLETEKHEKEDEPPEFIELTDTGDLIYSEVFFNMEDKTGDEVLHTFLDSIGVSDDSYEEAPSIDSVGVDWEC